MLTPRYVDAEGRSNGDGPLARLRNTSIWFKLWHCQGGSAKIFDDYIILISNGKSKQPSSPGRVAKRFLTATLFLVGQENSSSEFARLSRTDTRFFSNTYAKVAQAVLNPRDLEANLLLKAAARLRLWIVFMDAVMRDDSRLPIETRQNLLNLRVFVMAETFSFMTAPKREHLANLIRINRAISAGLGSKAGRGQP